MKILYCLTFVFLISIIINLSYAQDIDVYRTDNITCVNDTLVTIVNYNVFDNGTWDNDTFTTTEICEYGCSNNSCDIPDLYTSIAVILGLVIFGGVMLIIFKRM